jgi:hypothetical protein
MNLKELLTHISITTLLLFFLFFCGTLYIISYWTTFNFDITNYIELFDIPKSFVFPLATGLGVSFLSLIAQALINAGAPPEKTESRNLKSNDPLRFGNRRGFNSNRIAVLLVVVCMLLYDPYQEWIVITIGLTVSFWGVSNFNRHPRIKSLIVNDKLRLMASVLIVFVPIYSVCKGKLDSIAVWKNRNYYVVVDVQYTDETQGIKEAIGKKLLGKLGNSLIVTDSSNLNISVVALTNVDMVKYRFVTSSNLLSAE